jgi:dienelactone hydrolase
VTRDEAAVSGPVSGPRGGRRLRRLTLALLLVAGPACVTSHLVGDGGLGTDGAGQGERGPTGGSGGAGAGATGTGGAEGTGTGGSQAPGTGGTGATSTGTGGTGSGGGGATGIGGTGVSMPDGGASDPSVTAGTGGAAGARGPDPTEQTASTKGPYQVMRYSSGLADSPAYAGYDVDYPTNAPTPLAGVAAIPGFIEARSGIGDWGPFLASHGFVVITVDPNTGFDGPPTRADALWAAVESLKAENTRAGSPLLGKVDTSRFAVMGHSMGGGGTLDTARIHGAELRADVPLAPWHNAPAFTTITVPTMIMAGQDDAIAPIDQHASPFYESIPATTRKTYVEFAGGDHFVANSPVTNASVALLGLSWLKVHLEGDQRYSQFIKTRAGLSRFLSAP